MLVIRMQRTGRKGHAQFRVVVQDSRRTPTSGKIVAQLGHYNPHTKTATVDKEKAGFYLDHGAQPSDRVARLLKAEGVKLPDWVQLEGKKKGAVRSADKRRSTRPASPAQTSEEVSAGKPEAPEEKAPAAEAETPAEETAAPEQAAEEIKSEPEETAKERDSEEAPEKAE